MARTSRKANRMAPQAEPAAVPYQAAIYARLSVEDNGRDSDSLENQISFLEGYIAEHPDIKKAAVFIDNGYTGTNFQRPEFQRMLEAVKAGAINCIVVKDLSRLGRNYVETGEFIEKVCPFLHVRLIAVNDGYDTAGFSSNAQLAASLSNIINDYYARDISRKVSSALRTKMERGDYIGNYAPYGYQKDPDNKNRLLIDTETAPVVRRIFQLRADRMSYGGINALLNQEGIPSPGQMRRENGIRTNNNQKPRPILWNRHVLTDLLHNTVYTGSLAQRKGSQCLYAGIPFHVTAPEEWVLVPDTHPAIIEQELFDTVQEINREVRERAKAAHGKYDSLPKARDVYGKKLVCGDCGAKMKLHRSFNHQRDKAYFTFLCPTYSEHGSLGCSKHSIRKETLDRIVMDTIHSQIQVFLDREKMLKHLPEQSPQEIRAYKRLLQEETKLRSRSAELYIDWKDGLLSEEEYLLQRDRYKAQQEAIQTKIAACPPPPSPNSLSGIITRFQEETHPTPELIAAFISSISVQEDGTIDIKLTYEDTMEAMLREGLE